MVFGESRESTIDAHESLSIGSRDIFTTSNSSTPPPFSNSISSVSGPLRAKSVSEDPVGAGQEWTHRGGQRATLQVSRGGEPAERRVQVCNIASRASLHVGERTI